MSSMENDNQAHLYRLIYASRWVQTSERDQSGDTLEILLRAMAKNHWVGVTGTLLVHDGHFVQALEGPIEEVVDTFERIEYDARHEHVTVLAQGPIHKRLFDEWTMGVQHLATANPAALRSMQSRRFDPMRMSGDEALSLLGGMRRAEAA
jgi:hypothetical protein